MFNWLQPPRSQGIEAKEQKKMKLKLDDRSNLRSTDAPGSVLVTIDIVTYQPCVHTDADTDRSVHDGYNRCQPDQLLGHQGSRFF
jgi:hypothetical protein